MSIKPLEGIRVLDFTFLPPGGYCTVQLADLGADVIRVESPALSGKKSLVIGQVGLSRGKKSITLDMRHGQVNDVLKRLAPSIDVVVENAMPGKMEERGFGYAQAAEANPGMIWCSITGFGQDGPYADRAGHDISYMGHSGFLAALSSELPWHPGAMVSVPVGAMMAVTGILGALRGKDKNGLGCQLDISLAEATTWLLAGNSGAVSDEPMHIPATPDRRLYQCADGRYISVAAAEPRTWAALCKGVEADDLSDKLGDKAAADQVTARLKEIFARQPAAAWIEKLGPLGAAVNPVNIGKDVSEDPHYKARDVIVDVDGSAVPTSPIRMRNTKGETSTSALSSPPIVGEHTEEILLSGGFTGEEISALRADKVI